MRQHHEQAKANQLAGRRFRASGRRALSALPVGVGSSLGLLVAVSLCLAALAAPAGAAEGCENEARRVEQGSTFLPDCRAYELVSQPYQPVPDSRTYFNGFPPSSSMGFYSYGEEPVEMPEVQYGVSVAQDGNAALFGSYQPNSESDSINSNLSRRVSTGWVGENIIPRVSRHGFLCDPGTYVGYSENMQEIAISLGLSENFASNAEDCGRPEPELVPGESRESANLFLRDTATGSFELINITPQGTTSYDPHFAATSADGSHIVFLSRALLTPEAPSQGELGSGSSSTTEGHCTYSFGNVYLWSAGAVHLVTVLPDGSPVQGTLAGGHVTSCDIVPSQTAGFTHSVSADGERIVFYAGGGFQHPSEYVSDVRPNAPYIGGGLYLRERASAAQSQVNGSSECAEPQKACTVQVDRPEGGPGSPGGGQFQWADSETTKIFFTDEEKLTPGATAEAGKPDLYEYDLEKPAGQRLTDLTPSATEPADVLGVSGASQDGAYIYFVADGDLTSNQENSHEATAIPGQANLYLRHAGATTFVATLDAAGGDQCDWIAWCLTSRVSQNGLFLAFDSIAEQTGYDNHPTRPEACQHLTLVAESPCVEAFRYAADSGAHGELTCATCNPSGAPPAAEFAWSVIQAADHEYEGITRVTNAVSDSGQVFFETMEKLASEDDNETWDVYEYDGGEGASARQNLISSGKNELPSYFDDATPDGRNVFFVTDQSLLHADDRADYDLYDARVNGGFVSQSEAIQPPSCESLEGCHSPLSEPPAEFSAASASLSGAGNLTPTPHTPEGKAPAKSHHCRKGLVHRHGRCVKKRGRKHGKLRGRNSHHFRRAHGNRGGGK